MTTLETVLSKRWILKSKDKELYYKVKDNIGEVKKFINEKLGYPVIVNQYMIKVEKTPAEAESWMGILDFSDKMEYIFLCLILMFLEDKEAEEQFVLSELTDYIQSSYKEEEIDWTLYNNRRHLVKVIKYCVNYGIIFVNDGDEESFAKDDTSEVLYENTGASRYFMKNFSRDIMEYNNPEDFAQGEWIDVNEDRGVVRRQRVYRSLLMCPGMYKTEENEEDFAYIRNYRNMIGEELAELFDCELQVYRTSAFLILGEECRLGKFFPEESTSSDIILLCNSILNSEIKKGNIEVPPDEHIRLTKQQFQEIIEECKLKYSKGFVKKYRDMSTGEFYKNIKEEMKKYSFIRDYGDYIEINTIMGKAAGAYPKGFDDNKDKAEEENE